MNVGYPLTDIDVTGGLFAGVVPRMPSSTDPAPEEQPVGIQQSTFNVAALLRVSPDNVSAYTALFQRFESCIGNKKPLFNPYCL